MMPARAHPASSSGTPYPPYDGRMGRQAAAPGTARKVPSLWEWGSTLAVPLMDTARGVRPHGGPH
eukprot:4401624-Pyramimonas_sp.AAC.1